MTDIDKALAYVREMIECSDDLDGHEDREDLRRVETLLMKLDRMELEVWEGKPASAGANAIHLERARQIEIEGWTPQHDDEYVGGDLARAAVCYAWVAVLSDGARNAVMSSPPQTWPETWDYAWWKPEDRRRDLVKAGALIAAEIDRLDRAAKKGSPSEGKSEAATFQFPPDAKVTLSSGELPSIAREPGARRLPVLKDSPEVEWSEPENIELVLDEDGVKRWMLSTREGEQQAGHDGLVLEMCAEHYKAGTKLCLEEPLEDLWNDQEGGAA